MANRKVQTEKRTVLEGMELLLVRKRIKNMYLRVLPPNGEVRLTVPLRAPRAELAHFVARHRSWLLQKQRELRNRRAEPLQYVSGEQHFLWGKPYELCVRPAERNAVFLKGSRIILGLAEMGTPEQREQILLEWYRYQLKSAIERRLPDCERIAGKCAAEWGVRNMRTRWGTCNIAKRRIWLNLQLAKKPPECLDYVILHELTHLYERHHNARFHAYMDSFCPDWRELKQRLNQN